MDEIDLDLSSLDLKTIDLNSGENNNTNLNTINNNNNQPDLSISTSNDDLLPSSNSIDIDLGLNLLANKSKQKPVDDNNSLNTSGNSNNQNNNLSETNLFGSSITDTNSNNDLLNTSSFDNITDINLDKELNDINSNLNRDKNDMSGPGLPDFNKSTDSSSSNNFSNNNNNFSTNYNSFNTSNTEGMSYEDIQKAKFDLLCKFERLRDKGVKIPKTFSMSSDYEEMKYEYDRLVHQRKMQNSVKMQRQMLISFVTGAEFLNSKFDPFDLKLDNWSENVNENINDYDDIFEELYEKYKDSANMAPELRLMFTLAGSAFMYHLSNTMFKSSLPNMNDVMRQNPDLMKQFSEATMNTMGQQNPGFAGFMGNMMNNNNNNDSPPKFNPMDKPPFSNPTAPPRDDINLNSSPPDIDSLIRNISESGDNDREVNIQI
tara:strand:- start:5678 stop:6970 length:1293 start_codon:yes stop_codon:yes gene_type:complete